MKNFVAVCSALVLGLSSSALAAYDFLTISGNDVGGNGAFSQFNSLNGNGVITVTHNYTAGSPVNLDNVNSAIFPSQFQALFPGTGQVQGHLSQMNDNSIATVTFDLSGYNVSAQTVFGIWNITDETPGQPHYRVEVIDSLNAPQAPTTFNLIGKQDNEGQVAGRSRLDMDLSTGNLTATVLINAFGTHSNAAFWDNIPLGTQKIIVYGNLPDLATGDGVGYYFAEVHQVPEPTGFALTVAGLSCVAIFGRRRRMNRGRS
jgi:hypothetical protein